MEKSKNTKDSSISHKPSAISRSTTLLSGVAFLSFLGFLDATYLTIKHYQGVIPPCTVGGCETVLTSAYASIGPVPLAGLGVLFYLTLLILSILILAEKRHQFVPILFVLATTGLLFGIGLVGIQAFILRSYCLYCLTSEGLSLLIFLCSAKLFFSQRIKNSAQEE